MCKRTNIENRPSSSPFNGVRGLVSRARPADVSACIAESSSSGLPIIQTSRPRFGCGMDYLPHLVTEHFVIPCQDCAQRFRHNAIERVSTTGMSVHDGQ